MVDKGTALQSVRDEVKDIFASPEIAAEVDGMDDEEFRKSVLKLRNGIITYTPVFDGAEESEIWNWLSRAGLDDDGKSVLYDGRTGEKLENRVTTGVMYYLKLHHLVDEKIHARSTAPTPSSPSSRWAVRRSSAASVSGKWKCGPSKPTALPTCCRNSSPSSRTT